MQNIQDDLASAGKFSSIISAGVCTLFGLIFLSLAIYSIFNISIKINGTITYASCVQHQTSNPYNCSLTVNYNVNNKNYSQQINMSTNILYTVGQTIEIYYSPNNPNSISTSSSTVPIIIFSIIGILLPVIGWSSYYLTRKNKTYAEFTGLNSAIRLL
jgi:hypothetical protein